MTNEELKDLENKLWDAANSLRAYGGLKASDYAAPVLGLIFLKFADNKYSQYESEIATEVATIISKSLEDMNTSVASSKQRVIVRKNHLPSLKLS